ncbi:MAG: aminotransferase class V-fold PLP-dependent enzyme [Acidimicrobiales bacterium]
MTGAIDVEAERAMTPGCATVTHLNNAGAALVTAPTVEAMVEHLRLEAERGGYEAAAMVAGRLSSLRSSAARLIGARDGDVVMTGSDTQGWAKALWGFALGGGIAKGRRLLADRIAYDSHYLGLLQVCELTGATIEVVPSTGDGTLDVDALAAALGRGDIALAALTHVGTHRGLINPVEEAGAACRRAGVPFFLDACQSIGQLPVDVERINCDVATATGRKWLRGPRGTGLLFVRAAFAERLRPPGIGWAGALWEDAGHYRLRPGAERLAEFEVPVAAHIGLGVAIDHALALGLDAIAERVAHLGDYLREALGAVGGVEIHDGGTHRSGIVTFTSDHAAPTAVASAASAAGINVSVSEAPWARLDMSAPNPASVVRASPHYYNTEAELDRLVDVVTAVPAR